MIKHKLFRFVSKIIIIPCLLIITGCCTTKTSTIKYEPRVVKTKNELVTEYMKAVEVLRYHDLLEYRNGEKNKDEKR